MIGVQSAIEADVTLPAIVGVAGSSIAIVFLADGAGDAVARIVPRVAAIIGVDGILDLL